MFSKLYKKIVRKFFSKTFLFWQALGFHITPVHFYQSIPDTRELKDDIWQRKSLLVGVDMNISDQVELLSNFSSKFKKEYQDFPKDKPSSSWQYYLNNTEFSAIDGEILYCMIRYFKPKRIIEVGSGYSTCLMAQAIMKNKEDNGNNCELIAIDPYPKKFVEQEMAGLSQLIKKRVQDIEIDIFDKLSENDILFIDSSHILKIGSDVQREYLEILPKIKSGVLVHSHDIFFPTEYPKKWVMKDHLFFNEQYLLQAFLIYNNEFKILWAANFMHQTHPELLSKAFNSYNKLENSPSSFWIRRQ